MNVKRKLLPKIAVYISAVLFVLNFSERSYAQPRMPSQKDIDALNALARKMPTPEQDAEFSKISESFQNKYEGIEPNFRKLHAEVQRVAALTLTCPLTGAHIQAAIVNHRRLRALYDEHFKEISDWAVKNHRANCARQTEKTRVYMVHLSDQWLAKTPTLSLATVEDRAYSAYWIADGGAGGGFSPGGDPLADPKHSVSSEIIGLYGVCRGNDEFTPGAE